MTFVTWANSIVDKIFNAFIPIMGVRAQAIGQQEQFTFSYDLDEDACRNKLILIKEQLLSRSQAIDPLQIEAELRYIFYKLGALPLDVVNLIFNRYIEDQGFFTQLIVDLLAEDKSLPVATLNKLVNPLFFIQDIKTALFIALRLHQQAIPLPENILKYFVNFLSNSDKSIYIIAIELFYQIAQKSPQQLPGTIVDPILNLLPKVSGLQNSRLNIILDNLKLNNKQKVRREVQELVAAWRAALTIQEKNAIGMQVVKKITSNTAEDILAFFKLCLFTQHYSLYQIAQEALGYLKRHATLSLDKVGQELTQLFANWRSSTLECNLDHSCLAVSKGIILLTSKQVQKLKKIFKSYPWFERELLRIELTDYKSVDKLLKFIIANKLTEGRAHKVLSRLNHETSFQHICLEFLFELIGEVQNSGSLSTSDIVLLRKSTTDLVNNLNWPADRLYVLLKKIKNDELPEFILILELLDTYGINIETLNRNGLNGLEILEQKLLASEASDDSVWGSIASYFWSFAGASATTPLMQSFEEINNLIRDHRFFAKKNEDTLIEEIASLNSNNPLIKKLIADGYFKSQLLKIKKVTQELLQPKYRLVIKDAEPENYKSDTIYIYKKIETVITNKEKNEKQEKISFCIAGLLKKVCLNIETLTEDKRKLWENILASKQTDNTNFLCKHAIELGVISAFKHRCTSLADWKRDDYIEWRATIKDIAESNTAEIIAVLSQAVHNTILESGGYPRPSQILALLALLKSPHGGLAQIATGEGKSLIIAMLAAVKVMSGKKVDIVTSSSVLAARDPTNRLYQEFYNLLDITAAHNIDNNGGAKKCYESNIVYGDLTHFIGDMLNDVTRNIKIGRGNELVIVDEVDNMFIDELKMLVQLAWPMPGFELLNQIFVYMWGTATTGMLSLRRKNGKCYMQVPIGKNETLAELVEKLDLEELEHTEHDEYLIKVADNCEDYIQEFVGNYTTDTLFGFNHKRALRSVVIPHHLEEFAKQQLTVWLESLISSYKVKNKGQYIKHVDPDNIMSKNSTIIAPVDYSNTGVIQTNLHWSNALHQFLQLANGITIHPESIISIFMSYVEFFNKYRGNIFGVTGTLGQEPHHNFLKKVYDIQTTVIPTFAYKDFKEFQPIVEQNKIGWYQKITQVILRKIRSKRAGLVIFELIEDVERLRDLLVKAGYPKKQIFTYGIGGKNEDKIFDKYKLKRGDIVIATNMAGRGADLQISKAALRNGGLHVIMTIFSKSMRVLEQAYGRAARKGEPGSAQLIIFIDKTESCKTLDCLKLKRDELELRTLEHDFLVKLPTMKVRDQLFSVYIEFMRQINSTTRHLIKLGKPTASHENILYLHKNSKGVFLTAVDQTGTKEINITETLKLLDADLTNRINNILERANASIAEMNKLDYEAILFIAAQHDYVEDSLFYESVKADFAKLASGGLSEQDLRRIAYFAELSIGRAFTETLMRAGATKIKFLLWLVNREQYGKKEETNQLDEDWGIWLKKRDDIFSKLNLLNNANTSWQELQDKRNQLKERLYKEFESFKNEEAVKFRKNELIHNPAYLVNKAQRYFMLRFFYAPGHLIDGIISEALAFLNKALALDDHYSWAAHSVMSVIQLYQEGREIKEIEEAQHAYEVKKRFYDDTVAAIRNIKEVYIATYESQLAFLIAHKLITHQDELAWQLIGGIEIYNEIIKAKQENLALIAKAKEDEMIELADYVKISDLANKVDLTATITKIFKLDSSNTTAIEFSNKDIIVEQIEAAGEVSIPKLRTYTLEDNRSYFGNFFAMVFGIASIFTGCWMLGAFHSIFATTFATSLIIGGVGDILTSAYSLIVGQPIDIGQFLSSKAMSLGISLVTAGTLQLLGSVLDKIPSIHDHIGKILEKMAGFGNNIGMVFAIQATTMLATGLLYEFGRKIIDPDAIRKDAREAINRIINICKEKLKRIFATDFFHDSANLIGKLYKKIEAVITGYLQRFKGDGAIFGRGVATSTASNLLTGLPILGNVINAGVEVVTNSIKNSEAIAEISDGTIAAILEVNNQALTTWDMLALKLKEDFGKEISDEMVSAITEQKYVIAGEIDYNDCSKFNQLNLRAELSDRKLGIVEECEYIQAIMADDYENDYKILGDRFVDLVTSLKSSIQKEMVESTASVPGGLLGQYFGEKIYTYATSKLKELKNKNKAQGQESFKAGSGPEPEQKAKNKQDSKTKSTDRTSKTGNNKTPKPNCSKNGTCSPTDLSQFDKLWEENLKKHLSVNKDGINNLWNKAANEINFMAGDSHESVNPQNKLTKFFENLANIEYATAEREQYNQRLMAGVCAGLVDSGINTALGFAEILLHPIKTLEGIKNTVTELATNKEARSRFEDHIIEAFNAKVDRIEKSFLQGGLDGADQLGKELGSLIWDVGTAIVAAKSAVDITVSLAKAGVKLTTKSINAFSNVANTEILFGAGGQLTSNGKPFINIKSLSIEQKELFGDWFGGNKITKLFPGAEKLGAQSSIGRKGIDAIYKFNKDGVEHYAIIEYKAGTSRLKKTSDGLQMSDDWLKGIKTETNRILKILGGDKHQEMAKSIADGLDTGRTIKMLIHLDYLGRTSVGVLDKAAKIIPNSEQILKTYGAKIK